MKHYKLVPHTPYSRFRLGSEGMDTLNDTIHSDTLFSALINICAQAYGEDYASKMKDAFANAQIAISSACYGITNYKGKDILFFPKPAAAFKKEIVDTLDRKIYKKLKWISEGIIQIILASYDTEMSWFDWQADESLLSYNADKSFVALQTEFDTLIPDITSISTNTKVSINRQTGGATQGDLYYQADLIISSFVKGVRPFLYFFANVANEWEHIFNTCIRLLADTGIGGERSSGCGHFADVVIKEYNISTLITHQHKNKAFCLSLISPNSVLNNNESTLLIAYNLVRRGGRKHEEGELFSLNMAHEGAIAELGIKGKLVDISSNQSGIYRNGLNFYLKF